MIKHYQDQYKHLTKKNELAGNSEENKLSYEEEAMLYNLSEIFDDKNMHNVKVEFGRKYYNLVMNNLIANPRWNFSRKLFEQHATRAYFIENVPEKEKAQIFRFFHEEDIPFQGVFVLIGIVPNNQMLPLEQLETEKGFVITDQLMQTNIAGVYAVGDIRHQSVRQVVAAAGDGAVAEKSAEHYLELLSQKNIIALEKRKCSLKG